MTGALYSRLLPAATTNRERIVLALVEHTAGGVGHLLKIPKYVFLVLNCDAACDN